MDKSSRRLAFEHPGQEIGIEQIPGRSVPDARASLGLAFEQPLGGEHAERLPHQTARNAPLFGDLLLGGQERSWRMLPCYDCNTQFACQLSMRRSPPVFVSQSPSPRGALQALFGAAPTTRMIAILPLVLQ